MDKKQVLNESIETLANGNFNTSLITDSKLCFSYNDKFYRTRMPTQAEQALAEHKRNLIQLQYLNEEGCITKTQLIAKLKEAKIIDIELEEEVRTELLQELKQYWFLLATKDSGDKKKILEYADKIENIKTTLQKSAIDIATALTPCLENRLEKFYIEYLTSLCAEEQKDKEWVRIWNTHEDFNASDAGLSGKALANMTWLLLNNRG